MPLVYRILRVENVPQTYRICLSGSHSTLRLHEIENADPEDVRELLNYKKAFDLVADYLGSGEPIREGLIREIHKRLVAGVREILQLQGNTEGYKITLPTLKRRKLFTRHHLPLKFHL